MDKRYIIALDEGTTSVRTVIYDVTKSKIIATSQKPFKQYYPNLGWVEQNAEEIWLSQKQTLDEAIKTAGISDKEVFGLGITNQRETVVAWDKTTGKPIYNAIVWQCKRTSKTIDKMSVQMKHSIKNKTGLIPNAYFSATKIKWILDNVPLAKKLADKNNLCVGTIDSYLAYKLTGKFVTDFTNASRTMLFNINTLCWDDALLKYFNIPKSILPEVKDCNFNYGKCLNYDFELRAIIGDQQSSLVGQACFKKGLSKVTYGTGGFLLTNIGHEVKKTKNLLCTIAYTINGHTTYALEGSIYSACNAVDWCKNNLELYEDISEISKICNSLTSSEGVYFVPAFTGLGAPYWNDFSRATIVGMTLNTNKNHIIRAVTESMAYNTYAIVKEMSKLGINTKELHVDGGGSKNTFLLSFLADMLQRNILKGTESECTAMGAIYMVMLSCKICSIMDLERNYKIQKTYVATKTIRERNKLYTGWENAVKVALFHSKELKNEK